MAKDKNGFIPQVDIVKSGFEGKVDIYRDIERTEEGLFRIGKSKVVEDANKMSIAKEMAKHEEEMKRLKELADEYGLTKSDIKDAKDDIKHEEKKKKKKDKKKKKKKKSEEMDSYFKSLIDSGAMPAEFGQYMEDGGEKGKKKKKKEKKKKDKQREELGFVVKEKKKKKEGKKEKSDDPEKKAREEIAAEFKAAEKISRDNIRDIDDTMGFINARINEITDNGERMKSKDYILSGYINAKTSLLSTKQKVATDIASIKKSIFDIENKREKNATASSDADLMAKLFPSMVLGGKTADINKYIAENGNNKNSDKKKNKHKHKYDDDDYNEIEEDEDLDKIERKMMKSGDIEYSDYDKNIEYEGDFKVAIKKAYTTGEWKFVALDGDGNIIKGFPKSHLPSKAVCQMKFDDEKDMALDQNSNRSYQVFQVPTI